MVKRNLFMMPQEILAEMSRMLQKQEYVDPNTLLGLLNSLEQRVRFCKSFVKNYCDPRNYNQIEQSGLDGVAQNPFDPGNKLDAGDNPYEDIINGPEYKEIIKAYERLRKNIAEKIDEGFKHLCELYKKDEKFRAYIREELLSKRSPKAALDAKIAILNTYFRKFPHAQEFSKLLQSEYSARLPCDAGYC